MKQCNYWLTRCNFVFEDRDKKIKSMYAKIFNRILQKDCKNIRLLIFVYRFKLGVQFLLLMRYIVRLCGKWSIRKKWTKNMLFCNCLLKLIYIRDSFDMQRNDCKLLFHKQIHHISNPSQGTTLHHAHTQPFVRHHLTPPAQPLAGHHLTPHTAYALILILKLLETQFLI